MKKREKKKKKKKIGNQTEESTSLPLGKAQSLHFWILEEQRGAEGGHSTNWEIWEQSSAMGAKRFGILTSRSHRNIGVPFSQRASLHSLIDLESRPSLERHWRKEKATNPRAPISIVNRRALQPFCSQSATSWE